MTMFYILFVIQFFLFFSNAIAKEEVKRSLTILSEEWPPITYEEDGVVKGVAVDVVKEMQALMQDRNPITIVPWPRGFLMVQNEPNVILFTVIRSKEREHLFTMLGPLGVGEMALCGLEGSKLKIRSLEDAKKVLAIGANRGTYFATSLEKAGFKNLVMTIDPWQEARLLASKRIDLMSGDPDVLKAALKKVGLGHVRIKKYLVVEKFQFYIAFSKGTSRQVMEEWKTALTQLKKSGAYKKIYQKWLPGVEPPQTVELIGLEAK